MKRKHKHRSAKIMAVAKERIRKLFDQAKLGYKKEPELSHRYVQLARKIAMKYKIKLTSLQKRKFCKHCYRFLMPGENCRVRVYRSKIIYYCFSCKKYARIPIKPSKNL